MMTPLGDWLTTQEAAELSGYHINHIRRLVQTGVIYAQKFGGIWIVSRSALLKYKEKLVLEGEKRGPKSLNKGKS